MHTDNYHYKNKLPQINAYQTHFENMFNITTNIIYNLKINNTLRKKDIILKS